MAFTVTDEWQTSRPVAARQMLIAIVSSTGTQWLENPKLERFRKPVLISLSALTHAGFLYLLIQNGIVPVDQLDKFGNNRPTTFKLSDPPKPAPLPDQNKEGGGAIEPQAAPTIAFNFQQPPVMPSEWSIARIVIPRATAPAYSDAQTTQGITGSGGAGRGSGSGAGFDPYAGAAPKRQERSFANGEPATSVGLNSQLFEGADPALDREAFVILLNELEGRLIMTKGNIRLSVTLDREGRVQSAEILQGSGSLQFQLFVRSYVIGRKLFINVGSTKRTLPPIKVG
jgi:hypothetical protein